MIIQTRAIKASSGASKTANHIFAGEKNEKIEVLEGSDFQLNNAMKIAENENLKYGFHHFKISPKEPLTREQFNDLLNDLSNEYKFDKDDLTVVEHTKPRATQDAHNKHWHVIVPHYQQEQRKALDTKNSYARNEKIARLAEIKNGHTLVQGQHNKAVYLQLLDENKTAEAEKIKHLIDLERTNQSHTVNQQRRAEKQGIDLPKEKQAIKTLWQASDSLKAFKSALSEQGYEIKAGQKANTYIIEKNGLFVGSANRLLSMKKEEFNEKYLKEINENVQSIPKKTTPKKIRFKEEREAQNPTEANPTQSTETPTRTPKKRFNQEFGGLRKETYDNQPRDPKEHRQDIKFTGYSNRRTKPIVTNSSRYPEQSINNFGRNKEIERELKKLEREIKNNKFIRIQEKNIRKYENKKLQKQQKENEKILSEQQILLKIIEQLCNRLFGTPTQKQLETVNNLVKLSSSKYNKNTLMKIINIELKEVVFPKSLKEEQLNNLSSDKKDKEIKQIKKIYSSQSKLIKDINKKYNTELPNPSFSEFLESHKNRNELCKELLVKELKKEIFEKAENVLNKYIDNCEKSLKIPHQITDINEIKKDMSDKLFSSFQSSKNTFDKKEKDYNDINIKWFDKYFNKEKIYKKELLKNELEELKKDMNKEEDKYDHFKHFGNEISKVESDKRIRENKDITEGWKYKKSSEQLPILQNLKSSLNEDIVEKINNGELNNIIKDELEKIKIQSLENEKIQSLEKDKIENNVEHTEDNVVKLRFR